MARIRTIKPDFFMNEELAELPPLTRLFYIGIWTQADRAGRLEERPKRLKAALMPYDRCDVEKMLATLHDSGHIIRYEVAGQALIQVVNFTKHQSPHIKEQPSTIPAPDLHGACPQEGKGREGREGSVGDAIFEKAWKAYPLHRYKSTARQAFDDSVETIIPESDAFIAACANAPRDTKQSLAYFISDGTWRDHLPKPKRARCQNPQCSGGYIATEDGAVPCPECNGGAS